MKNNEILSDYIKYVSFNILGQMAYSCYTMADTFFVSQKLGSNGLTALNLVFPMFCIVNGIGLMIGIGGGAKYSLYKSKNEDEKANSIFTNALFMSILFSLFFVLLGLVFSKKIVILLGADETVFSLTHTYLIVMLFFSPAFLLNHLFQCFIRNDGNPALSSLAMITGSISNIILDYIFIFPMNMGMFGAIFATSLAPIISLSVLSQSFIRKENQFHLVKSKPNIQRISMIVSNGIPPFLSEATSGIVMFLFNFIILRISQNVGVAAFSIITVISLVVIAIYTGLSQGIQPLISSNYGAKKYENVRIVFRYAIITTLILSTLIYSSLFIHANGIVGLFNSEKDIYLQGMAVEGIKLYFLACPFIGLNIILSTTLICTEDVFFAQIISILRGFVVLVPCAFLLSSLFEMIGVWCAYPLSEVTVSCVGIIFHRKNKRNDLNSFSVDGQLK